MVALFIEHPPWIVNTLGHLATTFESTHIAPKNAADAFYVVVSGDDLLIKDDDGDITPIPAPMIGDGADSMQSPSTAWAL